MSDSHYSSISTNRLKVPTTNYIDDTGRYFLSSALKILPAEKLLQFKKAGKLNPLLLSSRSGCLPDELLRRNLELNVDFVILADLDSVDQRSDDHTMLP